MTVRSAACLAAALALAAGRARAAGDPPLPLDEVVTAALSGNIDVKLAGVDVDAARASWLAAAEPFDAVLDLTAQANRTHDFPTEANPTRAAPPGLAADVFGFTATASKLFRNGISVAPSVATSQTRVEGDPNQDLATATVQVVVTIPLLRDRGGAVSAAPERAARASYAAATLDARQAQARGVLLAAIAYWQFRAATDRLAVTVDAEKRAERTANEIGQLSRAEERTRADLNEALGHLSSRRAQRIAAEAQVTAAWNDLAVVSGFTATSTAAPAPATGFPEPGNAPPAGLLATLSEQAVRRRPDLASARRKVDAAAELLHASENALEPQLDLGMSAGYSSQLYAGPTHLFDPLVREIPGLEAGVQLRLHLPVERNGLRGREAGQSAVYQRQRLLGADLERQIRIGVAAAFQATVVNRLALLEAEASVHLLEQSVSDENAKFRVGASTLLAIIQAEEALTSGYLARIDSQLAFALALANLRFETGMLLPPQGERSAPTQPAAALAALLTVLPTP